MRDRPFRRPTLAGLAVALAAGALLWASLGGDATARQASDQIFTRADGGLWGKSHQMRPMLEACQRAKIKPAISFHVLRHTHGSVLAMCGVPLGVIAEQLGHADTRMTEKHYAHLAPSYVADTIRAHFPTLGVADEGNIVPARASRLVANKVARPGG